MTGRAMAGIFHTFPRYAGEGGAQRRMGVPRNQGVVRVAARRLHNAASRWLRGTPIRPSGTFPRGAGEGMKNITMPSRTR